MRAGILASISVALLLALFVALGFVGCGRPVPVGTWRGTKALEVNPGTDPIIADQLRRVIVKIDASGNGDLDDGGVTSEGQVSWDGDRLKFEVIAKLGINISKQPAGEPRWLYFERDRDALVYEKTRLEKVR